jgi:hypothetical protein
MKTKYPSIFGLLAAVLLVASFVLPTGLVSPASVAADPGICKWDALTTPGYLPLKNDIGNGLAYEIHDMVVGGDGATVLLVAQYWLPESVLPTQLPPAGTHTNNLYYSSNNGLSFSGTKNTAFQQAYFDYNNITTAQYTAFDGERLYPNVWMVAIAPDNPSFWAIVTTDNVTGGAGANTPVDVWITANSGNKWECTQIAATLRTAGETIRSIDISVDYGGRRDIAIGTVDGAGGGDVYVVKSTGFGGWKKQNFDTTTVAPIYGPIGDFYAVKFSPSYASDASLVVVSDNIGGTYYNISMRDIDTNTHKLWAFLPAPIPGVKLPPDAVSGAFGSPLIAELNKVDLELPSDFSGQAASLRRAYISLDTYNAGAAKTGWDGILRVDNDSVYVLMDTVSALTKSIYSIAYFGTYASGKLLAGERMGWPCTAEVMTWFTDSPTTCPIPCWYPALKPTTGAAGITCVDTQSGIGAALVGWKADGQLAFVGTGSHAVFTGATWFGAVGVYGWLPWWTVHMPLPPFSIYANGSLRVRDESAFGISRNNGETWNQIALIDTTITSFTDIAPSADCKTIYLASVNTNGTCWGFDSVWRTSSNMDVTSPYAPLPVGIFWERVLTRVTAPTCSVTNTNVALLRLVPYCADPTGEVVAWGVYDTLKAFDNGVAAWSPDFGDYWANITPRDQIQDFTFESRTVMYFLSPDGAVQKMPYTGTAWSTALSSVDTIIYGAHTIAAYPEGKVIVGANVEYQASLYATSFSSNFNTDNPSFAVMSTAGKTAAGGNVHVAFSPNFKDDSMVFIGDQTPLYVGSIYRNNPGAQLRWGDTNMLSPTNNAVGCPSPIEDGIYGIALAYTGEALYAAARGTHPPATLGGTCGVWRTIDDGTGKYGPLSGMPKPGIAWDFLNVFVSGPTTGPCFTLEPSSLKICGCCTMDTDSTLYAIDNYAYTTSTRRGLVWGFTDCLAKRGPALVTEDKTLIGCDPVSGRAQEVNLCWEQLCVADMYDIEIAKDATFTIRIIDWVTEAACGGLSPVDVTSPCVYFPAGGSAAIDAESDDPAMGSAIAFYGNLECGHTYYWRVKARECATTQIIRSPWSEVRSFTVKAGLPVVSTYLGLTLLAPNNGCLGCPIKPVSFSWSPFKETTKYKFQLASDAGMTQLVKETEVVNSTAYEYDGALDYSTNYFWRVMSMEPAPSDWSATFSLQTEAKPAEAAGAAPVAPTPIWVWVVIAIGAILVIVTLVLIFKTRRV